MIAWFICPYKTKAVLSMSIRYCAMDDFTPQIHADLGAWDESEILGNLAIVKVRANAGTLTTISAAPGFTRIPNHTGLSDTLGDLTVGQRQALLNIALQAGYSQAEIGEALPADWTNVTLGQVLRFLARRRLQSRFDTVGQVFVLDGPVQPVKDLALVDLVVQ